MSFNKWFKKLKKEYDKRAVAITLSTETYIQELKEAYEAGQQDGESMHELQTENFRLSGEIKALGERCNQLIKDKGDLTDKVEWLEGCKTELGNFLGKANDRVKELEKQIEKMRLDVKQEQSYWNSCEMQYDMLQKLIDKWELAND